MVSEMASVSLGINDSPEARRKRGQARGHGTRPSWLRLEALATRRFARARHRRRHATGLHPGGPQARSKSSPIGSEPSSIDRRSTLRRSIDAGKVANGRTSSARSSGSSNPAMTSRSLSIVTVRAQCSTRSSVRCPWIFASCSFSTRSSRSPRPTSRASCVSRSAPLLRVYAEPERTSNIVWQGSKLATHSAEGDE